MEYNDHPLKFSVSQTDSSRIDGYLAKIFNNVSRGTITRWISDGKVSVNAAITTKNNAKICYKDSISVIVPAPTVCSDWHGENITLDIIFEDHDILVLNKPSNLTMHPGAGQSNGTLANALAYYDNNLTTIPRMGIVHRLDKNTSGILVVAKTIVAHHHLVTQIQQREMIKTYHTMVNGNVIVGGTIDAPIGRHLKHRTIMAINEKGKEAISHYRVLQKYKSHTLLQIIIETGRTHQIRVHMQHIKHAILGDRTYGRGILPKGVPQALASTISNFKRQALHAYKLEFVHPVSKQVLSFTAPYPEDFASLIELLTTEKI